MKDAPIAAMSCRLPLYCMALFALLEPCWSTLSLEPAMKEVVKYLNETYIVSCRTNDSNDVNGPGTVKWTKGKTALVYKEHPHIFLKETYNSSMLIFDKISATDKGEYVCRYQDETMSFKLVVVSPIDFKETPSEQVIQENRPGIIKCLANGDPKPKIMWKFEGNDVNSNRYKFLPDGLEIYNVSLEDKGTYTCRGLQMSSITSMYEEKAIYVNVQHKPLHKKHPVHAKVNQAYGFVGGMVNLTCEAEAEPAANFSWFRQHKKSMPGRIIEPPQAHWSVLQLFIENASVFGDYLCRAQNSLGTLEQIITLTEGVQPPAPRQMLLLASGSDSLELKLVAPLFKHAAYEPHMLPTGYRFQYRVVGAGTKWEDSMVADFEDYTEDDQYPYILMGLAHNTKYEIRAATRNAAGLSEYTLPRTFQTQRLRADSVTSTARTSVAAAALLGAGVALCALAGSW